MVQISSANRNAIRSALSDGLRTSRVGIWANEAWVASVSAQPTTVARKRSFVAALLRMTREGTLRRSIDTSLEILIIQFKAAHVEIDVGPIRPALEERPGREDLVLRPAILTNESAHVPEPLAAAESPDAVFAAQELR